MTSPKALSILEQLLCEYHTAQMEGQFQYSETSSDFIWNWFGNRSSLVIEIQVMIDTTKMHNISDREPIP